MANVIASGPKFDKLIDTNSKRKAVDHIANVCFSVWWKKPSLDIMLTQEEQTKQTIKKSIWYELKKW